MFGGCQWQGTRPSGVAPEQSESPIFSSDVLPNFCCKTGCFVVLRGCRISVRDLDPLWIFRLDLSLIPITKKSRMTSRFTCYVLVLNVLLAASEVFAVSAGEIAPGSPVVARIEMRLATDEETIDVIAKGDLLTLVEEREDDYVIMTHDGTRGAVDKVNAVAIEESTEIYTELIEENPEEGRFYTLRASAWWALGKTEEAIADFDQAIKMGYKEAHAYTSRGLFHAEMGNHEKAIADYNQSLELDPKSVVPIINRAAVYMNMRDYEKAIADYSKVLEEKKESATILHQRAIAYKLMGKSQEAIDDFSTLIKNNPEDRTAVMGRGYVYFQKGDFAKAIEDFGRAIELDGKDAVAWNNRGYNRAQLGQSADALQDYDRAIELAENYALAHQNRAWLLATCADASLRNPEQAVASATKAAKLNNHQGVSDLAALAAALAAKGEFAEAVGWQEKVVEMIDESFKPFAEKMLDRYQRERPFAIDPDAANEADKVAAEEAAAKEQAAKKAKEATVDEKAEKDIADQAEAVTDAAAAVEKEAE
jgi:tetratricopeptide (TPR) repeat protein